MVASIPPLPAHESTAHGPQPLDAEGDDHQPQALALLTRTAKELLLGKEPSVFLDKLFADLADQLKLEIYLMELPLEDAPPERALLGADTPGGSNAGARADGDGSSTLRGLRILIVDDEPDALSWMKRALEEREADVQSASSASAAMAALLDFDAELLVSDIGMPEKDGYELIREIRGHHDERIRNIPALALPAFAREEDRTRALLVGYQQHIPKPVEPAVLFAVLADMAGATRAASTGRARPDRP